MYSMMWPVSIYYVARALMLHKVFAEFSCVDVQQNSGEQKIRTEICSKVKYFLLVFDLLFSFYFFSLL